MTLQVMKARGRPKTNVLPRSEQLRIAKRAQRERQRRADLVAVQLVLPKRTAEKLAAARRAANFPHRLEAALDRFLVRVADYPQLQDLAWNRVDRFIPADEALKLYERNWRFIDVPRLEERERLLIEQLKAECGNGEINA
jgi:hypothetical protein